MDINEKQDALFEYCHTHGCEGCPLVGEERNWKSYCHTYACLNIMASPEEDLDKALAIIGYRGQTDTDGFNAEVVTCDEIHPNDPVNHPSHYTDGKIEVIDFITDKNLGFCLGNAVKYIARAGKKDPSKTIEDLEKAVWYINHHIKTLKEE